MSRPSRSRRKEDRVLMMWMLGKDANTLVTLSMALDVAVGFFLGLAFAGFFN